jgi:NAD(P)-dependent dehydrogenase (short-subunit alcohol dehydrogenase family)
MEEVSFSPKCQHMKRVLIIGATGGIGSALADAHVTQGWSVEGLSRKDGLDLKDPASIEHVLHNTKGPFDRLLIATGVLGSEHRPPEKSLSQIQAQSMSDQFAINTIGPALILRHAGRLIVRDRPGLVAVLSARVGSIGDNRLGGWHSYRASKAALNQILRGAAIELARSHRQLVALALHPGTVATPFTAQYAGRYPTVPPAEAAENLMAVMDRARPCDTGRFLDWSGAEVPW